MSTLVRGYLNTKAPTAEHARVPVLDVVLLNVTLALFFLYTYSEFVMIPVWSYARWVLLTVWMLTLALRLAASRARLGSSFPVSSKVCGVMLVWFGATVLITGSDPGPAMQKLGALVMLYVFGYFLVGRLHSYTNFLRVFIISLAVQVLGFLAHGLWAGLDPSELGTAREFGLYHRGGSPSLMAATLIAFALAVMVARIGRGRVAVKVAMFILLGLAFATIYATGTRTGLFAPVMVAALWFVLRQRKRLGLLALAVFAAVSLWAGVANWYQAQSVFARGELLSGRVVRYQSQLELFASSPFIGTGFAAGIPAELSPEGHGSLSRSGSAVRPLSHSAYLGALTETGVIGGLLFVAWMVCCVYETAKRALKRKDDWRAQFGFLFVTILALASVVESLLLTAGGPLNLAFYVIIGLVPSRDS